MREQMREMFGLLDHLKEDERRIATVIDGARIALQSKQDEHDEMAHSWEALRKLLETYSQESINLLESMLNEGMSTIFHDQDYRVEIEVTDHRRKSVKLWLYRTEKGKVLKSKIPTAIGGGITVVLSFLFTCYLIRIYDQRPVVLMDEAFTQVSSKYLENFIAFLRYLIKEMGFVFLWVTHDERVLPHLDRIYQVRMGEVADVSSSPIASLP